MAKIISFNNHKGGTAKTTSSVNLAKGLANNGKKVLLIDLDYQGNASAKFLKDYEDVSGIVEILEKKIDIKDGIKHTSYENLDIIPAKLELEETIELMSVQAQITLLRKLLEPIKSMYDYIILDNNPSYKIMVRNCVYAADLVIVPVNIDSNSIKGVDYTIRKILGVIDDSVIDLNVDIRILINKATRTNKCKETIDNIRQTFTNKVLNTIIREQPKPAESQTFNSGYFIVDDVKAKVGQDYVDFANEIINLFEGGK